MRQTHAAFTVSFNPMVKVAVPLKALRDRVCRGDPSMKRSRWVLLIVLAIAPVAARAQQSTADKSLTTTQKFGQRVFEQRCAICHAPARAGFQMYGPVLYKELVNGNEDAIKEMIRSGTAKMPGFKFGLEPAEVDAIVEYLKTVPKPMKNSEAPAGPGAMGPVD
jgi:mono/diheme cytochrome c family protein